MADKDHWSSHIPVIGGGIAALSSIGQGRKNRQHQAHMLNKQLAFTKNESELAYQRSVADWNRQNAYNDPAAQMERYKGAGLNPHLIYGTGSASSGNASQQPNYHAAPSPDFQRVEPGRTAIGGIADAMPAVQQISSWLLDMEARRVDIESKRQNIKHDANRYPLMESILGTDEAMGKIGLDYQNDFKLMERDEKRIGMMRRIEDYQRDFGTDPNPSMSNKLKVTGRKTGMKDLERVAAELRNDLTSADVGKRESEARIQAVLARLAEMGLSGPMLALIGLAAGGIPRMIGAGGRAMAGKAAAKGADKARMFKKTTETMARPKSGRSRKVERYEYR